MHYTALVCVVDVLLIVSLLSAFTLFVLFCNNKGQNSYKTSIELRKKLFFYELEDIHDEK